MRTLFEPFRRLEASRDPGAGGTELGLTNARRAVEGHGGGMAPAGAATISPPRCGCRRMTEDEGGQE
jgi:hypothetical protein